MAIRSSNTAGPHLPTPAAYLRAADALKARFPAFYSHVDAAALAGQMWIDDLAPGSGDGKHPPGASKYRQQARLESHAEEIARQRRERFTRRRGA